MRTFALLALVGVLGAGSAMSADDKKPGEEKWPAYVDGKYVRKTITFKPDKIEFRMSGGRAGGTVVIFRIKDEKIPADVFTVYVRENHKDAEDVVAKYLKARDGKVTVDAYWVNPPVLKKEWRGTPESWIEGRPMLGKLDPPIDEKDRGPGGG